MFEMAAVKTKLAKKEEENADLHKKLEGQLKGSEKSSHELSKKSGSLEFRPLFEK